MGQTDRNLLLEMGFDPKRVDLALKQTGGLQDALTWLESHENTSIEELEMKNTELATPVRDPSGTNTGAGNNESSAEARSYKCNDCGKLLKNWAAVQFHAEKTEHQNFDESTEEVKSLTEEEKKMKLEELKLRLAEKKKQQAAESLAEVKKNEAIRRKRDQESEKMKEELRKKEQLREIERRKQEKIDDAKARAKIKAEIAATQQARREAAAKAKAERDNKAETSVNLQPAMETVNVTKPTTAHKEARLRFQFSEGRLPLTKSFPAKTSLFEVAAALAEETGISINTFTTNFPPRKTYSLLEPLDSSLTVEEANWTPSASLNVG
ncbi:hypothetical protein TWF694_005978 [Orbilia ellipsospora]|uniref:C2H2-type domain-containing protein n=1 Tax=Orbilia ellipsospora TaxID=2528407 RepID=A0AAV9WSH5_9PEZI